MKTIELKATSREVVKGGGREDEKNGEKLIDNVCQDITSPAMDEGVAQLNLDRQNQNQSDCDDALGYTSDVDVDMSSSDTSSETEEVNFCYYPQMTSTSQQRCKRRGFRLRRYHSHNTSELLTKTWQMSQQVQRNKECIRAQRNSRLQRGVVFSINLLAGATVFVALLQPSLFLHVSKILPKVSMQSVGLTLDSWVDLDNLVHVVGWITAFLISVIALLKSNWTGWVFYTYIKGVAQWAIALYQIARVMISMMAYAILNCAEIMLGMLTAITSAQDDHGASQLRSEISQLSTYQEFQQKATVIDLIEGKEEWKKTFSEHETFDFDKLGTNIRDLVDAVDQGNVHHLVYILGGLIKRNKLGIDSPSLHLECLEGSKDLIDLFDRKVIEALEYLADNEFPTFSDEAKLKFFKKLKRSYGCSALCLSGGGSLGMYHMGVVKALIEADYFPNVVSGSSGGSIVAAIIACKNADELLHDAFQDDISTRYMKYDIMWFPPLIQQLVQFMKSGVLLSNSQFEKAARHFYAEPMNSLEKTIVYTFQDAYEKTGRHVSIAVSASEITGHKGPKKLLLNHINTPHVLLWSAVAVSCSLPGIMKGKKLMARDAAGNVVPYVAIGEEWIDGSMHQDIPQENMSTLFNATNFLVSQVNPHIVPFLSKDVDRPGARKQFFRTLETVITTDVRHRLGMLSTLGLFPRIYGQQFGYMFQQSFVGHVTIVPTFRFSESIGLKVIMNPTVEDMHHYIQGGQEAAWPKINYIRHLCCIEKCLDKCIAKFDSRAIQRYNNWLHHDSKDRM